MDKYRYITKMSIDDWSDFQNDKDIHHAVAKIDFLTSSEVIENSHKHLISKDVLKRDANTFLGKYIVGKMDELGIDLTGHNSVGTQIFGYIPPSPLQEIEFYEDNDGELHVVVLALISKLYATDVYNLFKQSNQRNVSVEMLTAFSDETKDIIDGTDIKVVTALEGCSICLLGLQYNPSVPNANIQITQFSEQTTKDILIKYEQQKKKDINEVILEKLSNIENKLKEKGDESLDINKYAVEIGDVLWEVLYNTLKDKYFIQEGEYIYCKYYIRGIFEEGTQKFVIVEDAETTELFKINFEYNEDGLILDDEIIKVKHEFVEVAMFSKEDTIAYEKTLENKVEDIVVETVTEEVVVEEESETVDYEAIVKEKEVLETKVVELTKEVATLTEFKEKVELAEKTNIVDMTLAKIKDFVDEITFSELNQTGLSCTFNEINAWSNGVLATYFDILSAKAQEKNDGGFEINIPFVKKNETNSIW